MKNWFGNLYTSEKTFEREFLQAALLNERLRAVLLATVLSFVLVVFVLLKLIFPQGYAAIFDDGMAMITLLIFVMLIVVYELFVWYWIGKQKSPHIKPFPWLRYLNAFVEISLPSLLLFLLTTQSRHPLTLISPVVATYFLFIILSTLRLEFKFSFFTGLLAALQYNLIVWYFSILRPEGLNGNLNNTTLLAIGRGLMLISAGIAAGFVAEQIKIRLRQTYRLDRERSEIINLFGQHVSHSIVEELLRHKPELKSTRMQVTVLFLDIRDFTPFAEKRQPEEVVDYLNRLFAVAIEIINRHRGIINQFLGDGFMATFGIPVSQGNDALNALQAADEIIKAIDEKIENGQIFPTRLGIGLHCGEVIAGNIGTRLRKQYTITGDVVILASRIEQLNKRFASRILISDEVRIKAGITEEKLKKIGPVTLKGRTEKLVIYQRA